MNAGSPIFAALTTKRVLLLFTAPQNHLRGPWTIAARLNPVQREGSSPSPRPLASLTWLAPRCSGAPAHAWLLAGSLDGTLCAWRLAAETAAGEDQAELCLQQKVTQTHIYRLEVASWDREEGFALLAVMTLTDILVLRVWQDGQGLRIMANHVQPPSPQGRHIGKASWDEHDLLYCTPGHVCVFSSSNGLCTQASLERSTKFEGSSLQAAVGACWNVP